MSQYRRQPKGAQPKPVSGEAYRDGDEAQREAYRKAKRDKKAARRNERLLPERPVRAYLTPIRTESNREGST